MDLLERRSVPELEAEERHLQLHLANLGDWRGFSISPQGSFFLKFKQEQLDAIRRCYAAIDVTEEGALLKFARLQGYEESIRADANKLENLEGEKERLDKEIKSLRLVLKARKEEGRSDQGSSIISDQIKGASNGGRE